MTFRTFSGPPGSNSVSAIERQRMLFKEFDTLDGALAWAGHLAGSGRVATLIEGDDGTHLDKVEIAAALNHPEAAGFGNC
jgi:hypothetical protein